MVRRLALAATLLLAAPAAAQLAPGRVQSERQALAQDAAEYATRFAVTQPEAERRLRAQEASVVVTDRLRALYADRLAGIAIEHVPDYRIVVLLTGDTPVRDETIDAAGLPVPVVFRTGARATAAELLGAIERHQGELRAMLARPPGMGVDARTGELVVMVSGVDVDRTGADTLAERLATLTGVPVRLRSLDRPALDLGAEVEGGARVVGTSPADGRRYACTTGFVVTDGVQTGIVTAAHCPDDLVYHAPGGGAEPLAFAGQWGWGHQDVQLHPSASALAPLFYADTPKTLARPVTGARARAATRAGDWVCHRGERTGYSCAEVQLLNFAPAGDLCGGACLPSWVTVDGPTCRGGDSGAPVFSGTTAFGLVKGGSYRADGSCAFYFYMSTDYLPAGWSLLRAPVGSDLLDPIDPSAFAQRAGPTTP